jgi:hypothetical protein
LPERSLAMENSGGVLAGAEASDGEQQRRAWPAGIQKSMGAGSWRHVQLGKRAVCEVSYVGVVQVQSFIGTTNRVNSDYFHQLT